MNVRTLLLVLLPAAFTGFVFLNWNVINATTSLSFGFWTAQAPLGLLLLGFTVLIVSGFLLSLVVQQATVLLETRRTTKELSAQRALADQSEASRFTALDKHLDDELQRLESQAVDRDAALARRLDTSNRRYAPRSIKPATRWPLISVRSTIAWSVWKARRDHCLSS